MEDDTAAKEAKIARQQEAERVAKVRSGTADIEKIFTDNFTDDTFAGRRQAYTDYATPQVEDQYKTAQEQLTYALGRSGMLDSSVRAEQEAGLRKQYDDAIRDVGKTAVGYENAARSDVETARAELIQMLNATGDVEAVTSQALQRSRTLSQQPQYSPIAQIFTQAAGAAGQQANEEKVAAASGGAYVPKYNTGLFSGSKNVAVS